MPDHQPLRPSRARSRAVSFVEHKGFSTRRAAGSARPRHFEMSFPPSREAASIGIARRHRAAALPITWRTSRAARFRVDHCSARQPSKIRGDCAPIADADHRDTGTDSNQAKSAFTRLGAALRYVPWSPRRACGRFPLFKSSCSSHDTHHSLRCCRGEGTALNRMVVPIAGTGRGDRNSPLRARRRTAP